MTDLNTLRFALATLVLGLSACTPQEPDDQDFGPDAGQVVRPDAPEQQTVTPDAPVDAAPVVPPCVPQVTQLLINPAFDMAPGGMGWYQRLASPDFPLITSEDGVSEHTPFAKAWLGGLEAPVTTITDAVYQDVVIPALTTHLVVTGFHNVRTGETSTTTEFDKAKIKVTDVNNVLIANVLLLSNLTATTSWTAFGHAFTQDLSGRTVRIHLSSINDDVEATSFFFDSLAITATHGCPTIP